MILERQKYRAEVFKICGFARVVECSCTLQLRRMNFLRSFNLIDTPLLVMNKTLVIVTLVVSILGGAAAIGYVASQSTPNAKACVSRRC